MVAPQKQLGGWQRGDGLDFSTEVGADTGDGQGEGDWLLPRLSVWYPTAAVSGCVCGRTVGADVGPGVSS